MVIQSLFPFSGEPPKTTEAATSIIDINPKNLLKPKAVGLSFSNGAVSLLSMYSDSIRKRTHFEEPPYEFDTIIKAIDTDSYVKMGFSKYRELFWKEGWDITGENPDAVNYIFQRIDLFEETMGVSFTDFLSTAVDQLIKFGNVFIAKARGNIRPYLNGKVYLEDGQDPIAGFYIIPTETVRILRDKYNNPVTYKQALDNYDPRNSNNKEPTWDASEVIHLYHDRKPGRIFGTPFIINVLDDVIALRQMEEDVQNLVHQEMYPLYTYTVGTEDRPSSPGEVEDAAAELANLRTEGGIVLPERHKVDVLGAEGNALNVEKYLLEFKYRVITGMGLSPHHLGIMNEGGNRAVTDTLDKALYDRIKLYQRYIENSVRLYIFNPLLREGGFDPMEHPTKDSMSDRCFFKFKEIDIDSEVKKENHYVNQFMNNAITFEELRMKLKLDPEVDANQLFMVMQHQLNIHLAETTAALQPPPAPAASSTSTSTRANTKAPSTTKGVPNLPNLTRGPGNISQPANQHGRRLSPDIKRIDDDRLHSIVEALKDKDNS